MIAECEGHHDLALILRNAEAKEANRAEKRKMGIRILSRCVRNMGRWKGAYCLRIWKENGLGPEKLRALDRHLTLLKRERILIRFMGLRPVEVTPSLVSYKPNTCI